MMMELKKEESLRSPTGTVGRAVFEDVVTKDVGEEGALLRSRVLSTQPSMNNDHDAGGINSADTSAPT